jgi:hypothetical protein
MDIKTDFYKKYVVVVISALLLTSCLSENNDMESTLKLLAEQFDNPHMEYKPCVWWHWMGSNLSKEGITKDLKAMKEAGIGGATIFNIASAIQESHVPTENNPWPEQTYRSDAYWDTLTFATSEAKRLRLKIGLHNTPGYSTTGGPWISEEWGIQQLVFSKTTVAGSSKIEMSLKMPELPVYTNRGSDNAQSYYYQYIAVLVVMVHAGNLRA